MDPPDGSVVEPFLRVLGPRLVALAVYGSAATGDAIPGFSDLDLWVVVREELSIDDAIELHRRMPEPPDVAYIQPSYHRVDAPLPHLVPGAYRLLFGSLPRGFLLDPARIVRSGADVLRTLPSLVEADARDWTGAVGEKRRRHVRLLATRLKPAVRAELVQLGERPIETWRMSWDELVDRWRSYDGERAAMLAAVVAALRATPLDERSCGELLLRLLATWRRPPGYEGAAGVAVETRFE